MTVEEIARQIEYENEVAKLRQPRSKPQPRRRSCARGAQSGFAEVEYQPKGGEPQVFVGRIIDLTASGAGIESPTALQAHTKVTITSEFSEDDASDQVKRNAQVAHCQVQDNGTYRIGFTFEAPQEPKASAGSDAPMLDDSVIDYYEVLQISSNAELDMIQRVYRMLAQRYHPDNRDTGNDETFRLILQAYRVLSDPEQRAAYDVKYKAARGLRWRIFRRPEDAQGPAEDRHIRAGILTALYTARKRNPVKPGLTINEMEDLLGCPREHLEFSLWYLQGKCYITIGDNARFQITTEGVDEAEELSGDDNSRPLPPLLAPGRPD